MVTSARSKMDCAQSECNACEEEAQASAMVHIQRDQGGMTAMLSDELLLLIFRSAFVSPPPLAQGCSTGSHARVRVCRRIPWKELMVGCMPVCRWWCAVARGRLVVARPLPLTIRCVRSPQGPRGRTWCGALPVHAHVECVCTEHDRQGDTQDTQDLSWMHLFQKKQTGATTSMNVNAPHQSRPP
jgi:hypothetical protein